MLLWILAVVPVFALILWDASPGQRRRVPPWLQLASVAWMALTFAAHAWLS